MRSGAKNGGAGRADARAAWRPRARNRRGGLRAGLWLKCWRAGRGRNGRREGQSQRRRRAEAEQVAERAERAAGGGAGFEQRRHLGFGEEMGELRRNTGEFGQGAAQPEPAAR